MKQVTCLIKPVSDECNMSCLYCFYRKETASRKSACRGRMSEATLKNTMRKCVLHAERVCSICFQGGEPTLAGIDFFKKAVEFAKQYNIRNIKILFSIQTNGLLLDDEFCRFLAENHFLVGLSLDGPRELHEKYRSNFDSVITAARRLKKHHVEFNILTVVTSEAAHRATSIYNEYKKLGLQSQQYIACIGDYAPDAAEFGSFLTELFELWLEDLKRNSQPYIRTFENYIGILLGHRPESCEQCGECVAEYAVEADGSVYPCDFYMTDDFLLGNFNSNSANEIDNERGRLGFVERSRDISDDCKNCKYGFICRSGCNFRRSDGKNIFCESYRMFFNSCLPYMKRIAEIIGEETKY